MKENLSILTKRFRDRVRTFCMNPYGEVVKEYSEGMYSVNGHSYRNRKTDEHELRPAGEHGFHEPL